MYKFKLTYISNGFRLETLSKKQWPAYRSISTCVSSIQRRFHYWFQANDHTKLLHLCIGISIDITYPHFQNPKAIPQYIYIHRHGVIIIIVNEFVMSSDQLLHDYCITTTWSSFGHRCSKLNLWTTAGKHLKIGFLLSNQNI